MGGLLFVGFGRTGLLLCGLGCLVFIFLQMAFELSVSKTNGCIVGRIKRTDGIDVSVELQYLLLSVKHRELHVISTI
jgi:hypothetical protein